MRQDMVVARRGADPKWPENHYVANITGRHIRQMVSALYAKNPKSVARRRPRLDFQVWDENEQTLMAAIQITQQFSMAMQTSPMAQASAMGLAPPMPIPPEVQQAQLLIQDFQAGMRERGLIDQLGKTLEILFEYYMKEQKPVEFKTSMKQLVRRVRTVGCGFAKIAFQREVGPSAIVVGQIADVRDQLNHIKALMRYTQDVEGEASTEDLKAKQHELELSMESLKSQELVLLREGLVLHPGREEDRRGRRSQPGERRHGRRHGQRLRALRPRRGPRLLHLRRLQGLP
jgi:hypothetical protein